MRPSLILVTVFLSGTLAVPSRADTLFKIDFSGTLNSGTLQSKLNDGTSYSLGLAVGAAVGGEIIFDLTKAPTPVVSTASNLVTTSVAQMNAPSWVNGFLNVQLPALPANSLPVPSTFSLQRDLPPVNGTYLTLPVSDQSLGFSFIVPQGAETVLASAQFRDNWNSPTEQGSGAEFLGLLISSFTPFFPSTPGIPDKFTAADSAGNSAFGFIGFSQDLTNSTSPLFGVSSDYSVSGIFHTTDATGELLVTPEPSTWVLTLIPLALGLMLRMRRVGLRGMR